MRMEDEFRSCPVCHEECAYIETENNWCVYVQCGNCGAHTTFIEYKSPEEKPDAERKVTELWNMGKVIGELPE